MTKKKSKRRTRVRQNLGLLPEQHRALFNDLFPLGFRAAKRAFAAAERAWGPKKQEDCTTAIADYVVAKEVSGELLTHNREGSRPSTTPREGLPYAFTAEQSHRHRHQETEMATRTLRAEELIIAKCLKK